MIYEERAPYLDNYNNPGVEYSTFFPRWFRSVLTLIDSLDQKNEKLIRISRFRFKVHPVRTSCVS